MWPASAAKAVAATLLIFCTNFLLNGVRKRFNQTHELAANKFIALSKIEIKQHTHVSASMQLICGFIHMARMRCTANMYRHLTNCNRLIDLKHTFKLFTFSYIYSQSLNRLTAFNRAIFVEKKKRY